MAEAAGPDEPTGGAGKAPSLRVAPIRPEEAADRAVVAAIVALWHAAGLTRPWNDPVADIALASRGPDSTILIARRPDDAADPANAPDGVVTAATAHGGPVLATAMVGHDGHRGWVYYLAVAPDAKGRGYGRAMMDAAEAWLRARGVPKVQLMVRRDNTAVLGFYDALGYGVDDVVVRSKRF
ncbi:acetyltransferase [Stappia sp. 22II-S9-Z10]|nr:acetyltransferase [Stappia sp. 22II-S9-Z10]